eukprot:TRINITY_DN14695_c0_g1_i3.p1 TRINITY_DN14695_c0_g1~~TRINITY_DN14695_c0_g1_i3.p1  ORF type:complete len:609 (-),score=129.17 TRINITY_DN14695_c0_g1_i3:133-1959(-)
MRLTSFLKLLANAGAFDGNVNKITAEIIFKSATKKKQMDFDVFMGAILKVSETKFRTVSKVEAAGTLITQHLLPLYSSICAGKMNTVETSPLSVVHKLSLDGDAKYLLNSVNGVLHSIYKSYMQIPMASVKSEEQTLKVAVRNLFVCLRDFGLLKNLAISKMSIVIMLNILVNTSEEHLAGGENSAADSRTDSGALFTFNRFLMLLYWLSLIGFDMSTQGALEYTAAEKVYFLLVRMQFSKGLFKRQPHSILSLLPPDEVSKEVIKNSPWKEKHKEEVSPNKGSEEEKEQVDKLEKLFVSYCPVSPSRMPLHKFILLLKDCEVITNDVTRRSISGTEAELCFMKATKLSNEKAATFKKPAFSPSKRVQADSRQDKLDFKAFCYALNQVAGKLYPAETQEKSFADLFENNVSRIASHEKSDMRNLLKKDEIMEVLRLLRKALSPYLPYYRHDKVINFESFMRFCKDFGVFPEIANKCFLRKVFCSLALLSQTELNETSRAEELKGECKEFIGEGEAIEVLGICALKSAALARDGSPVFKVLHLAEKLSRSSGVSKVKRMTGATRLGADDSNFLKELRAKYKNYFNRNQTELTQEDIMSQVLMDSNDKAE